MRRLTVLLFRDEGPSEDEYIGCVGNYGSNWRSAPGIYERLNVVDEATHERLVEALRWYEEKTRNCRKITDVGEEARTALDADGGERARAILLEIGAVK